MEWEAFRKVGDCKLATDSVVCPPTHRVLTPPPRLTLQLYLKVGPLKRLVKMEPWLEWVPYDGCLYERPLKRLVKMEP